MMPLIIDRRTAAWPDKTALYSPTLPSPSSLYLYLLLSYLSSAYRCKPIHKCASLYYSLIRGILFVGVLRWTLGVSFVLFVWVGSGTGHSKNIYNLYTNSFALFGTFFPIRHADFYHQLVSLLFRACVCGLDIGATFAQNITAHLPKEKHYSLWRDVLNRHAVPDGRVSCGSLCNRGWYARARTRQITLGPLYLLVGGLALM